MEKAFITSLIHSIISKKFPGWEIQSYAYNETPKDKYDYRCGLVEIWNATEDPKSPNTMFVFVNAEDGESYEEFWAGNHDHMYLFEDSQTILIASNQSPLQVLNYSLNNTPMLGKPKVVPHGKSLDTAKNKEGVLYKSNEYDCIFQATQGYIGLKIDNDSFCIIDTYKWSILDVVRDTKKLPLIDSFQVIENPEDEGSFVILLCTRHERYRIGIWKININKLRHWDELNYGFMSETGFTKYEGSFQDKHFRLVVTNMRNKIAEEAIVIVPI